AARISSGCASAKAACATSLLPDASASSTLRRKVRTRERRFLLTAVRRAIFRVAFLAEDVLAMVPLSRTDVCTRKRRTERIRSRERSITQGAARGPPQLRWLIE